MDPKFKADFLAAWKAGPEALAEFLWENFALDPHEHAIEDVEGLPEALAMDEAPDDDADDSGDDSE